MKSVFRHHGLRRGELFFCLTSVVRYGIIFEYIFGVATRNVCSVSTLRGNPTVKSRLRSHLPFGEGEKGQ